MLWLYYRFVNILNKQEVKFNVYLIFRQLFFLDFASPEMLQWLISLLCCQHILKQTPNAEL